MRKSAVLFAAPLAALAGLLAPQTAGGQAAPVAAAGPVRTEAYRVDFVRLGMNNVNGLLYVPARPNANSRIALVYTYAKPRFDQTPAVELATRGYRVLTVRNYIANRRGLGETPTDGFAGTSRAIAYARSLPGVDKVVLMGWGIGAKMIGFYGAAAEQGSRVCTDPRLIAPCEVREVTGLSRPDGIVMFDPGFGALSRGSTIDPAYDTADRRTRPALDMYAAANGYDPKTGAAHYSADFRKRYFAAQAQRNNALVARAQALLADVRAGKSMFADDAPFTVAGALNTGSQASLHKTDTSLMSRTKRPHLLLKADGTTSTEIIRSIRPATGLDDAKRVGACCGDFDYGARRYLANDAIRLGPDYAMTEDDVLGVDWHSSATSTPAGAEGITVPTLVLTQTCFQFVTPSEIVFDHLAAKDKTFVANEGAEHFFGPCKPEYGDTRKRTFDFVDGWLGKAGRF